MYLLRQVICGLRFHKACF